MLAQLAAPANAFPRETVREPRSGALQESKRPSRWQELRSLWGEIRSLKNEWLYRGRLIERASDLRAFGRPNFGARRSVAEDLVTVAQRNEIPHEFRSIGGRQVLHLQVELGHGEATARALRAILRRVGSDTIELHYKVPAAGGRTPYGHIAVRVGDGATYDLIGDPSGQPVSRPLQWLTGQRTMSKARRRNLRRFFESRMILPRKGETIFKGYLFRATRSDVAETKAIFERRIGEVTAFSLYGKDEEGRGPDDGVYSCGTFVTHRLPFLNTRGVHSSIGAEEIDSAAERSPALDAVIEYRLPAGASRPLL
jgi:hypothetical protein